MASFNGIKQNIKKMFNFAPQGEPELEVVSDAGQLVSHIPGDRNEQQLLGDVFSEVVKVGKKKSDYIKQIDAMQDYHIVASLLSRVGDDLLHREREGDLITIEHPNASKKSAAETVIKDFAIETTIKEGVEELLRYGELIKTIDYKNRELDDELEPQTSYAVFLRGEFHSVFTKDQKVWKPDKVAYFRLGRKKTKLKVTAKDKGRFYLYRGRPLFPPGALELLQTLKLMESIMPLSNLLNIENRQMITVNVPPGTQINSAFQIAKQYEQELNRHKNFDLTSSVDDMIRGLGVYKVIPTVGGKGQMDTRDLPKPREMQLEDLQIYKSSISFLTNTPLSYLLIGEEDKKSSLTYLKLLKSYRENLEESIKDFLMSYFQTTKNPMKESELQVKLPKISGSEELDTIEYIDGTLSTTDSVSRLIETATATIKGMMADKTSDLVNVEAFIEYFNNKLRPLTGKDLFNLDVDLEKIKKDLQDSEGGGRF